VAASVILALLSVGARAERIPFSVPLSSRGYERIGYDKGVTVYRNRKSDVIQIGAEGHFMLAPEKVVKALLSYDRHAGAVSRVAESRVL
jgi:hypothetical protein